ncbi:MAG: hypothetical protein HOP99_09085, partial [Dermatophilaceae bacterium]|nr:hypothetical protein [Dermatophilaceae bacterium]
MTPPTRRTRRWSTVDDLRTALRRRWDRGELLALLADRTWQPLRVPLRGPTAGELSSEFGLVQEWLDRLRRDASGSRAPAFRLETRSVGGRLVGANDLPCAAWFDTPEQVWRLLRVEVEVRAFEELYAATLAADPAVAAWVRSQPLPALKHAAEWPKLMATARWLAARVGAGAYLRQIDVPGVDTKFIERNRPLLADLLDVMAPGV